MPTEGNEPSAQAVLNPAKGYIKGTPLPEDKFAGIGKCASTGRDMTMCYQTLGDSHNPCILLVSGLSTTCLMWREDFCKMLVAAGFFVVRFDNRDAGLSTHMDGYTPPFIGRMALPAWASIGEGEPPYTLSDMAMDGLKLLTAIGVKKVHLFGASMGGMIVQRMALLEPARVISLNILFSHSGGPNVKPQTIRMSLAMLDKPASTSRDDIVAYKVRFNRLLTGEYELDEENTRNMVDILLKRSPDDKAGLVRQSWALSRDPSREEGLKNLNVPTTIIHGMCDTMIPYCNGVELAKLIPGAKLVSFARMGHSIPRELYGAFVDELSLNLKCKA